MIPAMPRGQSKRSALPTEENCVPNASRRQFAGLSRWRALLALLIGIVIGTALTDLGRLSIRAPSRRVLRGIDSQQMARLAFATQPGDLGYKRCRGIKPGEATTPHLRSVRQWFSSRTRRRESITLVTQLSLERWVEGARMHSR
jgi:hypothetical protein